ncbi:MAG: dephospho-CoA kinase [Pseudomonadota bacterium]
MIRLGLTGSIGMGKSTTTAMFAEAGVPVWDADAAVHALYAPGGAGAEAIGALVPGAIGADGGVDRAALRVALAGDAGLLSRIEAAIHPLVAADRVAFLARGKASGAGVVVLDIPLLFETGGETAVDRVVVVSAAPEIQRARVLARPGMTEEDFGRILARQMPDAEKRARADMVIDTGQGIAAARAAVHKLLAELGHPEGGQRGGEMGEETR